MDTYVIVLLIVGLASLAMAWMPAITEKTKISYAILYVLLGGVLYIFGDSLPLPDPIRKQEYTVHLTELVVIISLMGTGLKIDRPFSFKNWNLPLRLVSVTMLLSIAAISLLAWQFLQFDLASALLLGAVLAPTDPVLAADVQVGEPQENERNDVKFALTAEAGLNDGLAFPFTWLAIVLAQIAGTGEGSLTDWLLTDFFYRIIVGAVVGYLLGRLLAFLIFRKSSKKSIIEMNNGFIALAATLVIYAFTEMLHAYGFMAVFIGAVTLRNSEMQHEFHNQLHSFTDQIERILVAIVLILFGGSLVSGVLEELSGQMVVLGLVFVFVVRPVAGYLGLLGTDLHPLQRGAISFFGIKGIGSFFYLSFALAEVNFANAREIWSMAAFTVLVSLITHGVTAAISMKKIEEKFAGQPAEEVDLPAKEP
ncbi:cation:proton antiporter [Persicitalea jodogahamensis]|uniref:Cation transporter n=1 Tax=Persicitalea jodogahamensis TaxID=402147 RepID=A0A8J3D3X7_9BACT|nr:cation:proton antiporter [Persicitalea jodogahamensis]GHB55133.1 cation transporter [Persicitalea jodogahamensis]